MPTGYLGVSSAVAAELTALGWPSLVFTDLSSAEAAARKYSLVYGGVPVVLRCTGVELGSAYPVDPMELEVSHALSEASVRECAGVAETAGVADALSNILSVLGEAHNGIQSARKRKKSQAHRALNHFLRKTKKTVGDHIDDTLGDKKDKRKRGSKPKQAQQARPARKPKAGPDRKRPGKSSWAPRQGVHKSPHVGPSDKPLWSQWRTAKKDLRVAGKLNGKPATLTILSGKRYRVAKSRRGTHVNRPGMHGTFIANPSAAGGL